MSANRLRHALISDVQQVLALVPEEFAAYEAARMSTASPSPDGHDPFFGVRWAGWALLVSGAVLLVAGLVTVEFWTWGWILFWAGGTTFAEAGATFATLRLPIGRRLFPGDPESGANSELNIVRDALIRKLVGGELLGHVRTRINTMRASRLDQAFSVTSSPGLSEIHDSFYEVRPAPQLRSTRCSRT